MLRITLSTTPGAATIKLEGTLLAPWIADLHQAYGRARLLDACVRLDLRDVSFIDAAGERAICALLRNGVVMTACSNFVAELLQVDEP